MPRTLPCTICLAFAGLGTLLGCSADGPGPALGIPAGEPSAGATAALQSLLTPKDVVVGTPTEVYTRIARGALTCWFGASGPLKSTYIYHADAEPASKGGQSEIKILTRDVDAEDPRALRAYRVVISPSQSKTKVEIENVRIPEPLANRLTQDVERWSRAQEGCGEAPLTAGWGAEPVAPAPAKKTKSKAKNDKKP